MEIETETVMKMEKETEFLTEINIKAEAKTKERANQYVNGRTISATHDSVTMIWLRIDEWISG